LCCSNKIKSLERQLDDYISEVGILTRKADEEMRVRETERQDAVRREAQAAKAAAGVCVCDCACDFFVSVSGSSAKDCLLFVFQIYISKA